MRLFRTGLTRRGMQYRLQGHAAQTARPCSAGCTRLRRLAGRGCAARLEGHAAVGWKGMPWFVGRGGGGQEASRYPECQPGQDHDVARMAICPGWRLGQVVDAARIALSRDRLPPRRSFTAPRSAATNDASVRGTGQSAERPPPFPTASHPQSGTTTCLGTAAYWREIRRAFQSELTA